MRFVITTLLALGILSAHARAADLSAVKADAFASTTAVEPGKPFLVAVRFQIDPGWHIYWQNSGDSGTPTSIKFQLPEGFTAKPLDFPLPVKFTLPGPIIAYGYKSEAVLLTQITPPSSIASAEAGINIDVNWLNCTERICVPGGAKIPLTLPVANNSNPAKRANEDLFKSAQSNLPDPSPPADIATISSGDKPLIVSIDWKQPVKRIDAYPGAEDALKMNLITAQTEGSRTTVTVDARIYAGQKLAKHDLPLLIVYTDNAGRRRGFFTTVDLRPLETQAK